MGSDDILEVFGQVRWPTTLMFAMFLLSILTSLALIQIYPQEYRVFGEDTNNPVNPLLYVGLILVFTVVILFIAKRGLVNLIRTTILLAVSVTIIYVLYPLYYYVVPYGYVSDDLYTTYLDIPFTLAFLTSYVMVLLLAFHPEWYVVNVVGFVMATGVIAIFGISFSILPAMVLLIALAIYDAWAVYGRKHMIDLADTVTELHLPVMVVSPKTENYSYLREKGIKSKMESGEEREAMFMGLGDIVIPGVLVASAFAFLPPSDFHGIPSNLLTALGALAGGVVGFSLLMVYVLRGRPQAGLPLLNSGVIAGYILTYLLVYQDLSLGMTLPW